jgi:hypothetical protein
VAKEGGAEVGGMRFEGRTLTDSDLAKRKLPPPGEDERYAHVIGRLLDRIHVEATTRSVLTRSKESVVAASETVSALDNDAQFPNRWWPIVRRGEREEREPARPYAGGFSYAKASEVAFQPGALLIEVHAAFDEPKAWFDGAPTLRSKISLVAQDQVRRLRREIATRRKKGASAVARPKD